MNESIQGSVQQNKNFLFSVCQNCVKIYLKQSQGLGLENYRYECRFFMLRTFSRIFKSCGGWWFGKFFDCGSVFFFCIGECLVCLLFVFQVLRVRCVYFYFIVVIVKYVVVFGMFVRGWCWVVENCCFQRLCFGQGIFFLEL